MKVASVTSPKERHQVSGYSSSKGQPLAVTQLNFTWTSRWSLCHRSVVYDSGNPPHLYAQQPINTAELPSTVNPTCRTFPTSDPGAEVLPTAQLAFGCKWLKPSRLTLHIVSRRVFLDRK